MKCLKEVTDTHSQSFLITTAHTLVVNQNYDHAYYTSNTDADLANTT